QAGAIRSFHLGYSEHGFGRSFLVLDEPTSVLTPAEADEMIGIVRGMTERGELTVLMISHKFHEVTKFADAVSILRR
ncbi:hypothetical protein ACC713_38245, partial [Rhizobium johnstonii]